MTATDRARFFTGQYGQEAVLTEFVPDLNAWRWAGEVCWETSTSGYTCTRPPGHTGRHAAGTGQQIVAVWGKRHQLTWTSDYEPDYSTAEHPPVEHVRALLQAARP